MNMQVQLVFLFPQNIQLTSFQAVKEFSKSRLRKRVQSQNLRQGPKGRPKKPPKRAKSDGAPLTPQAGGEHPGEEKDALYLIREEVAIMKKARHPNLVGLVEVLDDPEEDSLYMVLEMCKKGVVMKVGLDEHADPYSDDVCRMYFRHLVLAIEYCECIRTAMSENKAG
jgi:[calcium/calmodulin-dependent protein kinase] kinase